MKRWASIQTKIINSPATFFFCLYTYPVFASGVTYTSLSSISSWQCSCKIPSPLNWISCNQLKCNMISNCWTAGQNLTEVHHRHEQLAVSPNLLKQNHWVSQKYAEDSIKTHLVRNSHTVEPNFSAYWIMNSIWSSNNSVFLQTEINNKQ